MSPQSSPKYPSLVLASSSPYRASLIEQHLGISPICDPPNIDELALTAEKPKATALRLAKEKACKVAERHPEEVIVVAGDQSASFQGELLRKPETLEKAKDDLRRFSGQTLHFFSALCVKRGKTERQGCAEVSVRFRRLTDKSIEAYIRREPALDCVGGFKNEGLGLCLFESIESHDPSALTGLPIILLCDFLADLNYRVL